ncbi:hypothetical protein ONZ51_g5385 [Trametes cubensis]|uniref:Uncharacterized protein n=1 Tax=Trametes cubensis TaxID=1111947 RepID=A0AAD7X9F7_9APHY|nr:hypothetical protein ONZ51_g5385 [Trametes cubensis]
MRSTETVLVNQSPLPTEDDHAHRAHNIHQKTPVRHPEARRLAETKEGQDAVVKLDMKGEGDAKTTAKVRWQDMVDGKGGEKDGLYEWVCTIPAGRKVVLEAQWDVKGPSDTQWNEEIVHFRAS